MRHYSIVKIPSSSYFARGKEQPQSLLAIATAYTFSWKRWLGTFLLSTGLVVLIFLPPFIPSSFHMLIKAFFQPVCHQIPDRSFAIDGIVLPVCHRCTGLYTGAWLSIFLYPWLHRALNTRLPLRTLFFLGIAPAALDWGLHLLGIWHNVPLSRVLTGGIAGLAIGYIVAWSLQVPAPTSQASQTTLTYNHE